jgi:hypothetical protein
MARFPFLASEHFQIWTGLVTYLFGFALAIKRRMRDPYVRKMERSDMALLLAVPYLPGLAILIYIAFTTGIAAALSAYVIAWVLSFVLVFLQSYPFLLKEGRTQTALVGCHVFLFGTTAITSVVLACMGRLTFSGVCAAFLNALVFVIATGVFLRWYRGREAEDIPLGNPAGDLSLFASTIWYGVVMIGSGICIAVGTARQSGRLFWHWS